MLAARPTPSPAPYELYQPLLLPDNGEPKVESSLQQCVIEIGIIVIGLQASC